MSDLSQPDINKLFGVGFSDVPKPAKPLTQQVISDQVMLERWRAHRTGLAPYYPLLYSMVIGMGAQRVFEFGMGESTLVLWSAIRQTGGHLVACSPDEKTRPYPILPEHIVSITALSMTSEEALKRLGPDDIFDLVLHDGSHSAEVVAADLVGIIPRMRNGGLILIHDVLHSYVGKEMQSGVAQALVKMLRRAHSVRLPFAFGLQVIQVFNVGNGPVSIGLEKASSPHHTERMA